MYVSVRPELSKKPANVDLQLPCKQTITPAQKLEIGHQNLEREIYGIPTTYNPEQKTDREQRVHVKPKVEEKPKWKALGSEPVEEREEAAENVESQQQPSTQGELVKREPIEEPAPVENKIDISLPMQFKPVKTKPEPSEEIDETVKTKEEKLEAAKSSSSKKEKVVAFKKRNKDTTNMRERLTDD
jgi:hypothetical protein